MDDKDDSEKAIVSDVSAGIGAVIGFKLGGPGGAAVGASVVPAALRKTYTWLKERYGNNEERQQQRALAGLESAATWVDERLERGDKLRADDFFTQGEFERASAEEILEGATLRCRDEYQEKKCLYISRIPANACFVDYSVDYIHTVLLLAEQLTYRQMVVLALFGSDQRRLRAGHYRNERSLDEELTMLLVEIFRLHTPLSLVICKPPNYATHANIPDPLGVWPKYMRLTETGKRVHELMSLEEIPEADIRPVVDLLNSAKPSKG